MTDHSKTHPNDRRLADIVREVKIAAADRTDVVVDIRDADRARLELLAQEVRPLLDDIDASDDRFDFGISSGLQPRLWIDSVAHVQMGHDRRVFRFVRDTRLGRVVISDTSDMAQTADAVGRYIAERIIERERILAGDFEAMKASMWSRREDASENHDTDWQSNASDDAGEDEAVTKLFSSSPDVSVAKPDAEAKADVKTMPVTAMEQNLAKSETANESPAKSTRGTGFALGASWFILGCVAGSAALVVAFWDRLSALIN